VGQMKIINTLTAFIQHKQKKTIGYKTYFTINDKHYFVETLTNDKKIINQKINDLIEQIEFLKQDDQ
jgi:hypothetical protein